MRTILQPVGDDCLLFDGCANLRHNGVHISLETLLRKSQ
jgi:hypothetical protein